MTSMLRGASGRFVMMVFLGADVRCRFDGTAIGTTGEGRAVVGANEQQTTGADRGELNGAAHPATRPNPTGSGSPRPDGMACRSPSHGFDPRPRLDPRPPLTSMNTVGAGVVPGSGAAACHHQDPVPRPTRLRSSAGVKTVTSSSVSLVRSVSPETRTSAPDPR